jgi:hypothetical protein
MNLESIVQFMREKGLGTPGQNLFAYGMPESVSQGLLVTSQMPIQRNKYVTQLRRGEFQVIARGSLHAELIDRLNSVSDALNVQGVIIGDMNFRFIVPLNNPLVFPRADSRLLEASVNFEFAFTQPA